jgi:hypothetical protein
MHAASAMPGEGPDQDITHRIRNVAGDSGAEKRRDRGRIVVVTAARRARLTRLQGLAIGLLKTGFTEKP